MRKYEPYNTNQGPVINAEVSAVAEKGSPFVSTSSDGLLDGVTQSCEKQGYL